MGISETNQERIRTTNLSLPYVLAALLVAQFVAHFSKVPVQTHHYQLLTIPELSEDKLITYASATSFVASLASSLLERFTCWG